MLNTKELVFNEGPVADMQASSGVIKIDLHLKDFVVNNSNAF